MKRNWKNTAFSWRRFLWRGMAMLMFFYLCADVTVLEYFCGNPSLGIPSYRQVVDANPQSEHVSKTIFTQKTIAADPSSKDERDTEIPFDADDCFCCSSHATINYDFIIVA